MKRKNNPNTGKVTLLIFVFLATSMLILYKPDTKEKDTPQSYGPEPMYKNAETGEFEPITQRMKDIGWRVNSNGATQAYMELTGNNAGERLQDLLSRYGHHPADFTQPLTDYQIRPEVGVCISKADSSLGRHLTTAHNYGNVGNNDRGDRVHFASKREGIAAIGRALNNQYLGDKETVGQLSPYKGGTAPFYATSQQNWEINVLNCLSMVWGHKVRDDYPIRDRYIKGIELHFTEMPIDHIGSKYSHVVEYHKEKFGIDTCGYHYFVGSDGTVKPCRDESQIGVADNRQANNYRFLHISFAGDDKPNTRQTVSIAKLVNKLQKKHNLPKEAVYSHYTFAPNAKSEKESISYWYGSKENFFKILNSINK